MGYSHQAFQPSGGAAVSEQSFGTYPCRLEISWYIEDSFVSMNVAHDFDREENDAIVATGNHWRISNKVSPGSTDSIV